MAEVVVICTKQTEGIYFLTEDGSSQIEIYRRLRNVHGDDSINVSSIRRWARRFERGEKEISGRPRSGRPAMATTMETTEKVDALIRDNHRYIDWKMQLWPS
jgi:transposase